MHLKLTGLSLFLAFLLIGAVSSQELSSSIEGYWRSEGYGLLFEFSASKVSVFELTSVSCIPAWTAIPESAQQICPNCRFLNGFESGEESFQISVGPKPDTLFLKRSDAISRMILHKLNGRPPVCNAPLRSTALNNYDVLWTTFQENYPSFDRHKIDWKEINRQFRPLVRSDTSEDQLFEIFKRMLEPLHDVHVLVQKFPPNTSLKKAWLKTALKSFQGRRPDSGLSDQDLEKSKNIIPKYVNGPIQEFCNGKLQFGLIEDSIGYLNIQSFHNYAENDNFEEGMAALKSALAVIFSKTVASKGLIIDIRFNSGGDDPYGFLIASHLTAERYLAWAKQARNDPEKLKSFSTPDPFYIEPADTNLFSGKAVLLTSRETASAAEVFAMALMGRSPHIIRIGDNTQGVFSDVLDRRLPNGWRMVLPNEILVDGNGQNYDVSGIPPDFPVSFLSEEDIAKQEDSAIELALKLLQ